MSGKSGFESVKQAGATWDPRATGSQKEGDYKALEASDDSFIIGWFLGTKSNVGKHDSNIHGLKIMEVGNDAHVKGELNNDDPKVNIWGSGVLDSLLAENVQIGQCIMITWKGLTKTKSGTSTYHNWDVGVNPSIEPLGMGGAIKNASAPSNQSAPAASAPEAIMEGDDDDDLPF